MAPRVPLPRVHGPGVLYTALSLVLMVALASFTITARETPPPAVAEVAPDAGDPSTAGPQALTGAQPNQADQAQQAPLAEPARPVGPSGGPVQPSAGPGGSPDQGGARRGTTGGGGTGEGSDGGPGDAGPEEPGGDTQTAPTTEPPTTTTTAPGATTTTTTPGSTTTTTLAPRLPPPSSGTQRCVGTGPDNLDPPYRQTEDPRSPPCVISDTEATAADSEGVRGVNEDFVNIAVFLPSGGSVPAAQQVTYEKIENFLNRRYEFYGRQINFVYYPDSNGSGSDFGGANFNEAGQVTQANDVADYKDPSTDLGIFASNNHGQTPSPHYDETITGRGVVLVSSQERAQLSSDPERRKLQWHYQPDFPTAGTNLGKWLCEQFDLGQLATHAGPTEARKPRKFGYIRTEYLDGTVADMTAVDAALKTSTCGLATGSVETLTLKYRSSDPADLQAPLTGLAKMREDGVTSIVCACKAAGLRGTIMPAATNIGFFPEWVTAGWGQNDVDRYSTQPPDQMENSFGISSNLEWGAETDLPVDFAIREIDKDHDWPIPGTNFLDAYTWEVWRYPALLMFAAGVQAAGPKLTPETFRQGLENLEFPNPGPSDPFVQRFKTPRVGFGPGDHIMSQDFVVNWWNPRERSTWDGVPGTWCYSPKGDLRRFSFGTWTKVDLFSGACKR